MLVNDLLKYIFIILYLVYQGPLHLIYPLIVLPRVVDPILASQYLQ